MPPGKPPPAREENDSMGNRPYVWQGHEESHKYNEIVDLPHYVSPTRPHMSPLDRAAQFSPYDALNGYSEEIDETARTTEDRGELSKMEMAILSEKLALLADLCVRAAHERFEGRKNLALPDDGLPVVTVTYFVPDYELNRHSKKAGGAFISYTGKVSRVDLVEQTMTFEKDERGDGRVVKTGDVIDIRGATVEEVEERYIIT